MRIALSIAVAVALGIAWVLVIRRLRSRRRALPSSTTASGPVEATLLAYREARYPDVIAAAPNVLRSLHDDPDSLRWRGRIELVLGHSFFQLDQFAEAIPHLEAGLAAGDEPRLTGEARFAHCLGYAYQCTGREDRARAIYAELLADEDLDPAVRDGVNQHLAQLDESGE